MSQQRISPWDDFHKFLSVRKMIGVKQLALEYKMSMNQANIMLVSYGRKYPDNVIVAATFTTQSQKNVLQRGTITTGIMCMSELLCRLSRQDQHGRDLQQTLTIRDKLIELIPLGGKIVGIEVKEFIRKYQQQKRKPKMKIKDSNAKIEQSSYQRRIVGVKSSLVPSNLTVKDPKNSENNSQLLKKNIKGKYDQKQKKQLPRLTSDRFNNKIQSKPNNKRKVLMIKTDSSSQLQQKPQSGGNFSQISTDVNKDLPSKSKNAKITSNSNSIDSLKIQGKETKDSEKNDTKGNKKKGKFIKKKIQEENVKITDFFKPKTNKKQ